MRELIQKLTVEKDDGDGIITTFSDGTTAGYVAEELLQLRPIRELTEAGQVKSKTMQTFESKNFSRRARLYRRLPKSE